jgi:hypothetical protein
MKLCPVTKLGDLTVRVQMRGMTGVAGSHPMSTAMHITRHGAQIKFGYLIIYFLAYV